ncbi:uncharacterized protein GGS25DRAFT_499325 [Hypoxylon fragiforme]|uniref:uncharacterized protein n=1 Tax=Hypoxylon fragiforme TaxID=63214 RepID=UPI0020C6D2AD|nr:uncharacterized protein GGS25DRAFT_499325 [Hypoxylon fragiforme]KAI2606050.1 hypothetical protein GGS25DRAFT_499325 [Hypoxylon fragiforme]
MPEYCILLPGINLRKTFISLVLRYYVLGTGTTSTYVVVVTTYTRQSGYAPMQSTIKLKLGHPFILLYPPSSHFAFYFFFFFFVFFANISSYASKAFFN